MGLFLDWIDCKQKTRVFEKRAEWKVFYNPRRFMSWTLRVIWKDDEWVVRAGVEHFVLDNWELFFKIT